MTTTNTPGLRAFESSPGDSLLVPGDPAEDAYRQVQYRRLTGIDFDHLQISPLVAIPIPTPPSDGFGRRTHWAGARAELLWHPLMWLPADLTQRVEIDGQSENLDTFMVRVALELTDSGLYDVDSGRWVDVLALIGLDVDAPDDLDRVRRWMAGAADPLLDGLRDHCAGLFDPHRRRHLSTVAREALPSLWQCSYALAATNVRDTLGALIEGSETEWAEPNVRELITLFVDLLTPYIEGAEQEQQVAALRGQILEFAGPVQALLDGPVAGLIDLLEQTKVHYQPTLEASMAPVEPVLDPVEP